MRNLVMLTVFSIIASGTALAAVPDDLQQISVTIKAGGVQGSGTLFTRKIRNSATVRQGCRDETVTFVWTAAHVVDNLRSMRTVITSDGTTKTLIEYRDAEIIQERQQNGNRVGEVKYDCRIVKISDANYGEDLALLMVRCRDAFSLVASARFHDDPGYIPPIGIELAHCGSLLGQFGANSYTTGVLSQTGRMLEMKGANTRVFDQVTTVAFPGSSGGGVFLKENGEYIGMLTQGVNQLQGFNFIVPVRRMHSWAKNAKIEWAVNPKVDMPTMEEIDVIPVEDQGSPVATSPGSPPC